MCGVIPNATSLLSPHSPNGLNVSSALLLPFQKLEQQNFIPREPQSCSFSCSQPALVSSRQCYRSRNGLGDLSHTLEQDLVENVTNCLGCPKPCPSECTALTHGEMLPMRLIPMEEALEPGAGGTRM